MLKDQYFALQRKVFDAAFRLQDDVKQAAKGQPSLEGEDTGEQYVEEPLDA